MPQCVHFTEQVSGKALLQSEQNCRGLLLHVWHVPLSLLYMSVIREAYQKLVIGSSSSCFTLHAGLG